MREGGTAIQPGRMEPVEFGNGLRAHIAHEVPAAALAAEPLGPVQEPVPASPPTEPAQQSASAEWVRDLLRVRAAEQAERIWSVFDDALRATDAHGRPDHELRLRAARALMAEISGPPAAVREGCDAPRAAASDDELATLRRAKDRESRSGP